MVNYIEELKKEGRSYSIPVKPTSKLPISSKKLSKLIGTKLHEYLEHKISIDNAPSKAPDVPKERTIENLMSYLKKCDEHENTVKQKRSEISLRPRDSVKRIICKMERGKSRWIYVP